jgi:hypothetical protein
VKEVTMGGVFVIALWLTPAYRDFINAPLFLSPQTLKIHPLEP